MVASYLMGHSTPARQFGAADITLRRYTHTLPEDIEQARKTLARYLADRQKEQAARLSETFHSAFHRDARPRS
jgi:hypothetical protein